MLKRLRHALWMFSAKRLGYVRVAGLSAKNGRLVEAGGYVPLTRSNLDSGHMIVDARGDLWVRNACPEKYSKAAYSSKVERALLDRVKRLTPGGINAKLTVGFGDDHALDYFCDEFTFEASLLNERAANPYWLPTLTA